MNQEQLEQAKKYLFITHCADILINARWMFFEILSCHPKIDYVFALKVRNNFYFTP